MRWVSSRRGIKPALIDTAPSASSLLHVAGYVVIVEDGEAREVEKQGTCIPRASVQLPGGLASSLRRRRRRRRRAHGWLAPAGWDACTDACALLLHRARLACSKETSSTWASSALHGIESLITKVARAASCSFAWPFRKFSKIATSGHGFFFWGEEDRQGHKDMCRYVGHTILDWWPCHSHRFDLPLCFLFRKIDDSMPWLIKFSWTIYIYRHLNLVELENLICSTVSLQLVHGYMYAHNRILDL